MPDYLKSKDNFKLWKGPVERPILQQEDNPNYRSLQRTKAL